MKKTGSIWQLSARVRGQRIRRVCERLEAEYGRPRLGNPPDPVADLIYLIVSTRTSILVARRVYESLRAELPTWEEVELSPRTLEAILQPSGLASKKTAQIVGSLEQIRQDFGRYTLDPLRVLNSTDQIDYLVRLPGVSGKIARCVTMYTMEAEVLPVDSNVLRICQRLGWTTRTRVQEAHDELEALVPPHRRFAFHVNCVLHGQQICKAKPLCEICPVWRLCPHGLLSG